MSWISRTIASEGKVLDQVRRAFVREPTQEGLHRVRTGARRLRSFLEDVAERHRQKQLLRRAKRTAELTDIARDATVQRALLERLLVETEREAAEALLTSLSERESAATASARRKLRSVRYKVRGSG
jgi:CHAD domain-containing protein